MAKPRIRSIKPEFWTDDKVAGLPKATALFFIALWNFADDQGIFEDSSKSLSLRIPIFRSQDIDKMLNALWKAGLIMRSTSDGLVLVSGWRHQKIDRPHDGKWKGKEIQWLPYFDSTKPRDQSSTGSDRIGSDSIGSDLLATESKVVAIASTPKSKPKAPASKSNPSFELVQHWKSEFKAVYGNEPIPAGKEWGSAKNLLRFVPLERAKRLVTAYLGMKDHWFITKRHSLAVMLDNLDAVNTFLETGNTVNRTQIAQIEKAEASLSQLDRVKKGLL
jgi:hypothetical protein